MASSIEFVKISGIGFKATAAKMIVEADLCVRRGVLNIEGLTKRNIIAVNAVRTGFMLNSVYSVHSGGSGFQAARSAAQAKANRQFMQSSALGNVRAGVGFVVVGAEYFRNIELGTVRASARPTLVPAFEEARQPFLDDLAGIAGRLKK